ncbi:MAG: 2-dehydropantoate 2-reductase [Methanomassiliicoccus sp.]|nr:2-dehydropantoate 2-reductase [Methanomassiliicoccus sp.]
MRITVFGAGAVGSLLGGMLSPAHDVVLVGRREHVDAVNAKGLRVRGTVEATYRPEAREAVDGLGTQDVVLITVKAYDTGNAVREVAPLVGPHTMAVSVQNGLGNVEIMERAFGPRAIIAVPVLGVTYLGPGEVRLSGLKEVAVGSTSGQHGMAIELGRVLSGSGIPARVTAQVRQEVWLKAVVNASVNPITALVRKENGCILRQNELRELSRAACAEGARAAGACGVVPCAGDPFEKVMEVVRATAGNRSSMLQDVERGKRTEIDEINGALVRAGEERGVNMTVNRTLWSLVRSLR